MRAWIIRQDQRILKRLARPLPRWLVLWMHSATRSGDGWLWYGVGLFVAVLGGPRRWRALEASGLAVGIGILIFLAIKRLARRPRPANSGHRHKVEADQYSFPSGHTITAYAIAESLIQFYPHAIWFLVPAAALIAASRVLLRRHYLSDVIVGAVLGWGLGRVCGVVLR